MSEENIVSKVSVNNIEYDIRDRGTYSKDELYTKTETENKIKEIIREEDVGAEIEISDTLPQKDSIKLFIDTSRDYENIDFLEKNNPIVKNSITLQNQNEEKLFQVNENGDGFFKGSVQNENGDNLHKHSNKEVLDELSANENTLLFKGQEIRGGGGASTWSELQGKPFNNIDENTLKVENNTLSVIGGGAPASLPDNLVYYKENNNGEQKKSIWLKDKDDQNILVPHTLTNMVQDINGNNLDDILDENKINYEVDGTRLKISGGLSGESLHNYSTEEQVVGTWIDGKPIYEKIYNITNTSTSTSATNIASKITNANEIEMVIKGMLFRCKDTKSKACTETGVQFESSSSIKIYTSITWTNMDYILLQYTKVTD